MSAAKYGRPRSQVEQEIAQRLSLGEAASGSRTPWRSAANSSGSSFLDEWLAKRKRMTGGVGVPTTSTGLQQAGSGVASGRQPVAPVQAQAMTPGQSGVPRQHTDVSAQASPDTAMPSSSSVSTKRPTMYSPQPSLQEEMEKELREDSNKLTLRGQGSSDEVSIKLH